MGKATLNFASQEKGSLTSWLLNDAAVVTKLLMGLSLYANNLRRFIHNKILNCDWFSA